MTSKPKTVFRSAVRENVGLLIGLIGSSGSGKTYTAMRLASGICGDKPFAVIDTEAGRARHYADRFRFDFADLASPFTPDAYADAIMAADVVGYPAIVVDSCSHEWAGDGGVLDMQEEELNRMAGADWQKREACKMASWVRPKMAHKKMVQKLLQVRAHLILCFRAEEKIEMVRDGGKWKVQPKQTPIGLGGWVPICEKNLPYELTCSFLFLADRPGFPNPIKLQEQHKPFFPLGEPITEEAGRKIAAWAGGGKALDTQLDAGRAAAVQGSTALEAWWKSLPATAKKRLKPALDSELKVAAAAADELQPSPPEDDLDAQDKQRFVDDIRERIEQAVTDAEIADLVAEVDQRVDWIGIEAATRLKDEARQ